MERARAEGTVFTGDHQPAEEPEPEKPVPTKNPEPKKSEWAMTQEERDQVGKAHREMMEYDAMSKSQQDRLKEREAKEKIRKGL